MFDLYYIGENAKLKEAFPFAKQVKKQDEVKPRTKMYWLVEPNIEIVDFDVFEYRPENYDQDYEHVWKWDNKNYGGIKLLPKTTSKGTKEVNKVVCKKSFDILETSTPGQYFDTHTYATHVWCVDPEYKLDADINWAPDNFEPNFIHSFHLRNQLEHKYPESEGGIKLYPRDWKTADIKYHSFLDANVIYPIMYVADVNDYSQRDVYSDEYVWLIDREHKINDTTVDWVPNPFESGMIHCFRMPYQLTEKYPMQMGGIRLVPKNWKTAELKIHPSCPIEDESYDVFYIDEDEFDSDVYEDYARKSKSDWFWVVDRDYDFNGKLLYVPAEHEQEYIHVFKIPGMLEERYPKEFAEPWDNRCGGVRLVNKNFDVTKQKYQEGIVPVRYDIFYTSDMNDLERYARKSRTKMFWLVDAEHDIDEVFTYVPKRYDQKTILIFKLAGQLEHKYPKAVTNISDNRCGGIKLVPKNFNDDLRKYIPENPTGDKSYPVIFVDNVNDYTEVFQDCWVIDKQYEIKKQINWTPSAFQKRYMHIFHLGDQLRHKYPESTGGIRWIPVEWNGEIVVHDDMLDAVPEYPIYYSSTPDVDPGKDHNCWVADSLYRIAGSIKWAPSSFDTDKVHNFKVHNQLTHKYPENMGGLYWYPADNKDAVLKVHNDPLYLETKKYPVYRVIDPSDFSTVVEDCWLVDKEYILDDDDFAVIPWQNEIEQAQIHVYHVNGQLEHKYPDTMGGVYWVPANYDKDNINIHDVTPFGESVAFPVFTSEDEGRKKTTRSWFWVVDPNVELLPDFKLDYVPKVWDAGKTHVWQKLNPVTGRQYDYAGAMLCPKVPQAKGRPKYIREAACTQKPYPVYYLEASDYVKPLHEAYRRFESTTEVDMYWVVDAYTTVDPDFKFDYYPTQWDKHNVHVFANEDGEHTNIRLVPTGTFTDTEYTDKDIANNSFENLKLINTVASLRPKWPVVYLSGVEKTEFTNAIKDIQEPFVWTVDPDVKVDEKLLKRGYMPKITDVTKVHAWQKVNPRSGQVHAYGGLRLWPTANDYSEIKTSELKLNRIKNLQYVREPGSTSIPFEVVFLSYYEPDAENAYNRLCSKVDAKWIKNIDGIFEAHKAAANAVESKMFWVVDADAVIAEDFDFAHIPDVYDEEVVHVWASKNPVNGLEYGYGGVKLFNTQQVREATSWGLDFTTGLSSRFKSMPQVSCVTQFNTDAYSTWRSAFRECVKLTLSDDTDSNQRLDAWLNPVSDALFSDDAKRGAEAGNLYAKANKDNAAELAKINNYTWLREYYESTNN
jgi:hypothetical protein